MAKKSFDERYRDEILSDNASLNHFAQCKDCLFRYKDYFDFDGKRIPCNEEDGWKKGSCRMFPYPKDKPDEVYNNTGECDYYEREKRAVKGSHD